jgi:hypothetical protein
VIDSARQFDWRFGPSSPGGDVSLGKLAIEVVDRDIEAGAQQACGKMAAEIAQPDETITHQPIGVLVISRCSLSPV